MVVGWWGGGWVVEVRWWWWGGGGGVVVVVLLMGEEEEEGLVYLEDLTQPGIQVVRVRRHPEGASNMREALSAVHIVK